MDNIKSLYLAARTSGKRSDIASYNEAVQKLFESGPLSVLPNLEYIISSDANLKKLDDMFHEHGLAIPICNQVIELLESNVERCNILGVDSSLFTEALNSYKQFKDNHHTCFDMYEYYLDDSKLSDYVKSYYSVNSGGIQGRRLPAGMIGKFGESAIPDAIITSDNYGGKTISTLYEFLSSRTDALAKEWITECSKEIVNLDIHGYKLIEEDSLSYLINKKRSDDDSFIRESVLNGNENAYIPYSESDIQNIQDMIAFKEYRLTCMESAEDTSDLQNEIYSLYESLDSIVDESGVGIFESADTKSAAKTIAKKLINLAKDLQKDVVNVTKDVKKEVKKSDDKISKKMLRRGTIRSLVSIGDANEPFGVFTNNSVSAVKNTAKRIPDEATSSGKYLKDIKYFITFEIETGIKLPDTLKEKFSNLVNEAMLRSKLSEYVSKGIITFSKAIELKNPDISKSIINSYISEYYYAYTYTIYHYTIQYAVQISREFAFDGVDMSIFEGMDIRYLMQDVSEMISESYIPAVCDIDTVSDLEESRFDNTDNKYTGMVPSYMSRNHDLSWGETDVRKPQSDDESKSDEPKSIEDFKRPSAVGSSDNAVNKTDEEIEDDNKSDKTSSAPVNNYYYYQYTNSLNKNSNSFNKDNSSHSDDHSYHSTSDDHSSHRSTDDHSTGKRINSNDYQEESAKKSDIYAEREAYFNKYSDLFHGDWKDKSASEKQELLFKSLFSKDLKSMKLDSIPENITIRIGNTDFTFSTKVGYGYVGPREKITNFDQVPCAVYTYQSNKDKFTNGLGKQIGDALLKYIKDSWKEDPKYFGGDEPSNDIDENLKRFKFKAKKMYFNEMGHIGLEFNSDIEPEHGVGICILPSLKFFISYATDYIFESTNICGTDDSYTEAVGDADDMRPESDNPIKDLAQDVDRNLAKTQQAAKKKVQGVINAGNAFMKPVKRTHQWVMKMCNDWKDAKETKVKEKFADPHARKNIFSAITWCIKTGSLAKAGLLFNPVFVFLSITKNIGKKDRMKRIRAEMIGEIKQEIKIIEEKIKDADAAGDKAAKYKLMRLKNELNKKLLRVGGSDVRSWKKIL